MKQVFRIISVLTVTFLLLAFAGCSSPATKNTASEISSAGKAPQQSDTAPSSDSSAETKSLVVYFSWSGNTQQMAEWIADESGSDLYRVTPKESYSQEYDACADRAKNELDNGIRPELTDLMNAQVMAQYDTIYVGFPIWWYDLPMAITAFLESYELSGKTVIPFFSHKGSSSGASAPDTLVKTCAGAHVRADDALSIPGSDVENSEVQIRAWVNNFKN